MRNVSKIDSPDSEKPGPAVLHFKAWLFLSPEGRGHTLTQSSPTEPYLVIHHTDNLLGAAEKPETALAKHTQTQVTLEIKQINKLHTQLKGRQISVFSLSLSFTQFFFFFFKYLFNLTFKASDSRMKMCVREREEDF